MHHWIRSSDRHLRFVRSLIILLVGLVVLGGGRHEAFAWAREGHEVVALIAARLIFASDCLKDKAAAAGVDEIKFARTFVAGLATGPRAAKGKTLLYE